VNLINTEEETGSNEESEKNT